MEVQFGTRIKYYTMILAEGLRLEAKWTKEVVINLNSDMIGVFFLFFLLILCIFCKSEISFIFTFLIFSSLVMPNNAPVSQILCSSLFKYMPCRYSVLG